MIKSGRFQLRFWRAFSVLNHQAISGSKFGPEIATFAEKDTPEALIPHPFLIPTYPLPSRKSDYRPVTNHNKVTNHKLSIPIKYPDWFNFRETESFRNFRETSYRNIAFIR